MNKTQHTTQTTTAPGHTVTPWAIYAHNNALETEAQIMDIDEHDMIADCHSLNGLTHEQSVANAAHIVRCVNSHNKLVDILKEAQTRIFMNDGASPLYDKIHELLESL